VCLVFYEPFHGTEASEEPTNHDGSSQPSKTIPLDSQAFGYVPKAICILSQWPFITAFEAYLNQLWRYSKTPEAINNLPVEWLIFELVHRVPVPTAGTRLEFGIKEMISRSMPSERGLPIYDFETERIFYHLDVENLLTVLKCILLERRILLYSKITSNLTFAAETLTKLIFPFEWHYIYIPLLPDSFGRFLEAPMPYIIGTCQQAYLDGFISHQGKDQRKKFGRRPPPSKSEPSNHRNVPDDVILVHLDNNIVLLPEHDPLLEISLPTRASLSLKKALSPFSIFDMAKSIGVEDFHVRPLPMTPEGPRKDPIRNLFLNFFAELFKNYEDFLIYPIAPLRQLDYPEGFHNQRVPFITHFDELEFLCQFPIEDSGFFEPFFTTNLFHDFCHRKIFQGISDPTITFFDETISEMKRQSSPKLGESMILEGDEREVVSIGSQVTRCPSPWSSSLNNIEGHSFARDEGRLIYFPELNEQWMPKMESQLGNVGSNRKFRRKVSPPIIDPALSMSPSQYVEPRMIPPIEMSQPQHSLDTVHNTTQLDYRRLLLRELSLVVKRLVLEYHSLETDSISTLHILGTVTPSKHRSTSSEDRFSTNESSKIRSIFLYVCILLEKIFCHGFRCK
jgi:hypothetical protein